MCMIELKAIRSAIETRISPPLFYLRILVSCLTGQYCSLLVNLKRKLLKTVVALRNPLSVESVSLDDVCSCFQVLGMHLLHYVWLSQV